MLYQVFNHFKDKKIWCSCKLIIPIMLVHGVCIHQWSPPKLLPLHPEPENNPQKIWHPAWHSMFVISMAATLFGFNPKWDNYWAFEREACNKRQHRQKKGEKRALFKTVVSSPKYTQYTKMVNADGCFNFKLLLFTVMQKPTGSVEYTV